MSKATHADLDRSLAKVLEATTSSQVVSRLNQALRVAHRLPKPKPKPTALNRSAARALRRIHNKERRFTPRSELYSQHMTVLDHDGNELCQGCLTEIRSTCEYQIQKTDGSFEVFFIDSTDQFEHQSGKGVTLYGAHSLGDLA